MMITRSIYVDKGLWEKAGKVAGQASLSLIISKLLTGWLSGEIPLSLKPTCPDCNSPYVEKLNEVNLRCEACGYHFGVSNDPA